MNKSVLIWALLLGGIIGCVAGALVFGNHEQHCVADAAFGRIECCTHVSPDGHCAVGQTVTLYNV